MKENHCTKKTSENNYDAEEGFKYACTHTNEIMKWITNSAGKHHIRYYSSEKTKTISSTFVVIKFSVESKLDIL